MRIFSVLLLAACGASPTPPPTEALAEPPPVVEPSAANASVKPGINDNFLDPELDVDKWVERFGAESREVVARQAAIVAAMDIRPGEAVADVGAGTGLYLAPFAEAVGADGKVFAVDIAPRFLERLESMANEGGYAQVQTVLASERSAELAPASVDAIFVCDTYHHFEYPEATVASLYAALRPGGRLYVVDFIREEGVSSEWILGHVRGGQAVFAAEIEAGGFGPGELLEVGLDENYMLRFVKPGSEASE